MTKTFQLPNGITCVSEERPQSGKVSMQIQIKAGSADEQPGENGLTFLTQESAAGGTKTLSREQLAEAVESKGGGISSHTDRRKTYFAAETLTRYAKDTFAILADMVLNPAFDAAEIQKTKTQIAQWQEQQSESPATEATLKFYEAAFAGQPMGEDPMGTKELLASFTPEQVRQKHADLLAHPENIVISFAGDIDAATAEKLVLDYFGNLPADLPTAGPSTVKKPPLTFTQGDIREVRNNDQINLWFGFPAPPSDDGDKYAAIMLQEYLSGGMSSPLFQEVREARGLVYSIGATYAPMDGAGFFGIIAGAGKGNAGKLISVTMDVLGKVIREGVSQTDLDQAREHSMRALKGELETASNSCMRNADQISFTGRTVPLEKTEALLKSVTSDDIRRVCFTMLKSGNYALSGIGPQETMPAEQEIKDMMRAQVKDVKVPEAVPVEISVKEPFTEAAKKAAPASVEPKITVLENGMKIVTIERPDTLSCGAWIGAGSDYETSTPTGPFKTFMHLIYRKDIPGGSFHANEHMVFKGTDSYEPGEIDSIVEGQLGGGLNAYTSQDKTAYYFYDLEAGALPKIVDICGEMVFNATLDPAEFDGKVLQQSDGSSVKAKGERDVIIEEINMYNDMPDERAWEFMVETAYPDQPHGRPILGTEETLRAMTAQQLAACRDTYYVPNNMVFCAAGPVKHEDFAELVKRKYGQIPAKKFPPLPAAEYKGATAMAEHKNAKLCDVKIMAEGVHNLDPDSAAYSALGILLGNGASSRLNKKVVMEQQLSAGVGAGTMNWPNGGMFYVSSSMTPEKIQPFVTTVYAEMRAISDTLTQAELDKAKAFMEMDVLSSIEANSNACNTYASKTLANGRLVQRAEMAEKIQKLTVDDIKRVLKNVLASPPALTLTVPPGTDPRYLLKLDEMVALRNGKAPPKTAVPPENTPKP